MATVVLDAGHGGYDNGASNGARKEKDDNLRMTLAVGEILKRCGVNVVYTRTTDVFIPLLERSRISNAANADLFVSFHRNASVNPAANGVENWVYTSPSQKSVAAAQTILDRVVGEGVQNNRGVQYGNLSVLRHTTAPAVLLELGFISNAEDNRLFDEKFADYASAIASGILSSLNINCPGVNAPAAPPPSGSGSSQTIARIQQILNENYGTGLAVDGIWGSNSRRGLIKAFQTELNRMYNAGLTADGIWGPKTRAATRLIRQGDRNNLVWILQAALYAKGYPTAPDGIFGPNTDAALRAFQRDNGLPADGIAGPNTFEKLFQA